MLLAKTKLNTIKVLISKALIDSFINNGEFVLMNNLLRESNKRVNPKSWKCCGICYIKQWTPIVSVVRKILQTNTLVSEELNKIDKCLYEIVLFVLFVIRKIEVH